MIAKIPLRVDTGLVICVKNTGVYRDKTYTVKLSIGKLYRPYKVFEDSIYVKAPELVEYWSQFPEFLEYCTKNNIKWFFKESHMKKISECTNKHYLIELGNTEALKDFK